MITHTFAAAMADAGETCDDQATVEHPQPSSSAMPGRAWKVAEGNSQPSWPDLHNLLVQQHGIVSRRLDDQDSMLRHLIDSLPKASLSVQSSRQDGNFLESARSSSHPRLFKTFGEQDRSRQANAHRMSMRHSVPADSELNNKKKKQSELDKIVKSPWFEMFFTFVVVTQAIFIGLEVEANRDSYEHVLWMQVVQYAYAAIFTVELSLRLLVHRCSFFTSGDWAWNYFDIFIVATSIWEVVLDASYSNDTPDGSSSGVSGLSGMKPFRIIRITRLAKAVRLLRMFRLILALRTLIASIVNTLKTLAWALVLLGLIVYVFSVLFCQAVNSHLLDPEAAKLSQRELMLAKRHFASLGHSYLSLFMSIAGGVSWEELVAPLMQISIAWVVIFLFYISFTYFAV